jgi:hypothetical protein
MKHHLLSEVNITISTIHKAAILQLIYNWALRTGTMHKITARLGFLFITVIGQFLANQAQPLSKDGLRTNFKDLIAVNPNYFGNSPDSDQVPVFPLSYDTSFEQLTCIGFNPVLSVLEATIEVKLSYGFGGDLCTNGSLEYVRFYVRYTKEWSNLGVVTVNTHDIPDGFDCEEVPEKPLFYVLTLPFQPAQKDCEVPLLPEVRAILSWNEMPPASSPFWAPVYGNVVDQHIQSSALPPLTANSSLGFPKEDKVFSKHSDSQKLLEQYPNPPDKQHILSRDPSSTPNTRGRPGGPSNTFYEELIGLGLDYDLSRLVATIRIKQPVGYGSGLCENGTLEYIGFWADWNNTCNWTYVGGLRINVHNIYRIPRDGLTYSAALPVDLRSVSGPCNETKISRVRAALSWNSEPPIQPYTNPPNLTGPVIFTIGSVLLQNIDYQESGNGETLPLATFAGILDSQGNPVYTDPWSPPSRQCPFGGTIYITGPVIGQTNGLCVGNPDEQPVSQYQYRLVYRLVGSSSEGLPVLNSIKVTDLCNPNAVPPFVSVWQPNSLGYLPYLAQIRNVEGYLSRWTPPDSGLYQIRLEMATQTSSTPTYDTVGFTEWYNVQVNNQPNPAGPIGDITFTNEPLCGNFPVGSILEGTFWAVSPYFFQYEIFLVNAGIPGKIKIGDGTPLNPGPDLVPYPGISWSLDTSNSTPCGYVIELRVWDRTIYDSTPYGRIYYPVERGFCLSPPQVM